MAITEILRGIGSWSVRLKESTPKEILDSLKYFGHVAVNTGRVNPKKAGDALLAGSRYVGIYRGKSARSDQYNLGGPGMAAWLGDEDNKGEVFETAVPLNHDFQDAITLLLPDSVHAGAIQDINPGTPFVWTVQYLSPREAIDYICQTVGADWRVNGDGTLDAGMAANLFKVNPVAAVRRKGEGTDLFLKSLKGNLATDQDLDDFTTRVLLLATGSEGSVVTATADIAPGLNPYVDLWGNPVKLTRIVSESDTDATNATARAQLQLNRFSGPRTALTLSTRHYDIKGDVQVGDYIWAYDPEVGIVDLANEVVFQGERFWPVYIRLTEMTWSLSEGMSVAYRGGDGTWTDLTDYVVYEDNETILVVGGYNRNLGGDGGTGGTRPIADTSVPAAPTWNPNDYRYSIYQSPTSGETRAQVILDWNQPLNTDGTVILDGDHYEIRYRPSGSPVFEVTHNQMSTLTHSQLSTGTYGQPVVYDMSVAWEVLFVPFSETNAMIVDLPANMPYQAQIRAVDSAKPPNVGDWSTLTVFQTSSDTIPPATPAPITTVATSKLAVQILHELGRSDGGTFNLDMDLAYLEVHGGNISNFAVGADSLLGKVLATPGMIVARTPAVASFPIDNLNAVWFKVVAVDTTGNKSQPSTGVSATAELVDSAHISDLIVSKVTAGTISSAWILGNYIQTNVPPFARAQLTPFGLEQYDSQNRNTVWISNEGRSYIRFYDQFSTFRIEDGNGIARLEAGSPLVAIRDTLGNSVFSNVTANGWGVTDPAMSTPMYPFQIPSFAKLTFNGSDYRCMWYVRMAVSHPKLHWGYYWQVLFGGAVGAAGMGWSYALPTEFNPPSDVVIDATPNQSANFDERRSGVYTWPVGMYGQIVYVFLFARMTSGSSGEVGIQPVWHFGRGY